MPINLPADGPGAEIFTGFKTPKSGPPVKNTAGSAGNFRRGNLFYRENAIYLYGAKKNLKRKYIHKRIFEQKKIIIINDEKNKK